MTGGLLHAEVPTVCSLSWCISFQKLYIADDMNACRVRKKFAQSDDVE